MAELDELEAEALGNEMDAMEIGTGYIAQKNPVAAQPVAAQSEEQRQMADLMAMM